MWFRTNRNIHTWAGCLDVGEEWISAERKWIKISGKVKKFAICGLYMRVESPLNSDYYQSNVKLTLKLNQEITLLQSEGYDVGFLGDYNAHVGSSVNFPFLNNPHGLNNNGKLVQRFAEENGLYCMNPLEWNGIREEKFTYQKLIGDRQHASILDLGICTKTFMQSVKTFQVSTDPAVCTDTDHSTLVLTLKCLEAQCEPEEKAWNRLRGIKKWESYYKILNKRLNTGSFAWFERQPIMAQSKFITEELIKAGHSVTHPKIPRPGVQRSRTSLTLRQKKRETKKRRNDLWNAVNRKASLQELEELSLKLRDGRRDQFKQEHHDRSSHRTKVRHLIHAKGSKGSKLFWDLVIGKEKMSTVINALKGDNGITFDLKEKAQIVESFFKKKFDTNDEPTEREKPNMDEDKLGKPNNRLSDVQSDRVSRRVTRGELDKAISQLKSNKAEGMDGITNDMLKNANEVAKDMILLLFNNVLLSGLNPRDWKVGNIILLLKRPLDTDISNYRPITLISCLSKLLTSMLAQRISEAAEEACLIDDRQNGFRKTRSCSDNIFCLNALLEFNTSQKRTAHLLFVDLQEAYDRVNRDILFYKMRQMNFSERIMRFLEDYYSDDCITTESAGLRTKKQYQSRGLRQGCPLSSILFLIYVSELGQRLEASKLGIESPSGGKIPGFMFADDIVLQAISGADLEDLKSEMEGWCYDFRMTISAKKTEIISPRTEDVWSTLDMVSGDLTHIKKVNEYTYLGIEQAVTAEATSSKKGSRMLAKAENYRRAILRLKRTVPDQVQVYRATWENVAVPAILYGAEALVVSNDVIKELDRIQRDIAKLLLGVNGSTVGEVSELEMGFKPFHYRITALKIKFMTKTLSGETGCNLTKELMINLLQMPDSKFMINLDELLMPLGIDRNEVDNKTLANLDSYHVAKVTKELQKGTLYLMPIPETWWKLQPHVEEGRWSKTLSKFRCMNAGLGNRNVYYKNYAAFIEKGRVAYCPLCLDGRNDETHLVTECEEMESARRTIFLSPTCTLKLCLSQIQEKYNPESNAGLLRLFLGQEKNLCRLNYLRRGMALSELVDHFFFKWSEKVGRPIPRRPELHQGLI